MDGLEIYYDSTATTYWAQNDRSGWIKVKTEDVKVRLAKLGYKRRAQPEERVSQVDNLLVDIQNSHDVDYAGSLAGFEKGVYSINESRILVKDSPKLVTPTKGEWSLLRGVILNMLGDDQQEYFFGWLKVALEALYSKKHRVGQALTFAGPRDCGKSLVQDLITVLFGNRSQKAHRYMNGGTAFNGELFGAEHLMIEDEEASTDIRARRNFGAHIKNISANRTQSCHHKHRQAIHLPPFWRLTISVNDEPENLMILPPMDDSLEDKLIILKANKHPMPYPTATAEQRDLFMGKLKAELPHFVDFLLNWEIPKVLISERYGITHFHHPDILEALGALSPETRFLDIIDEELFKSAAPVEWEGTSSELERKLTKDDSEVKREASKLLSFGAACGTYLGRLQKLHKDRVSSKHTNKGTRWIIQPPRDE